MTKRKPVKPINIPTDATSEQIAEIRRHQAHLQTAALAAAINAVNNGNPDRAHLAAIAWHLIENRPDLVSGPMAPYIRAALRMFATDNPIGRPKGEAVALAVEFWQAGRNGIPLVEAHQRAATLTGRGRDAVRQVRRQSRKRTKPA